MNFDDNGLTHDAKGNATESVEKEYPDPTFHGVQVATCGGRRWQSSQSVGAEIPVVESETDTLWVLERDRDRPEWSFYVESSEVKRLYVTYNSSDQKVSLERADDSDNSKDRLFWAFFQPDGSFILTSNSDPQRFLGVQNGVLAMTDGNHFSTDCNWKISESLQTQANRSLKTYLRIIEAETPTNAWISDDAAPGDRIQVQSSSEQRWELNGSQSLYAFKVPEEEIYVSRNAQSEVEITFETDDDQMLEAEMRQFKLKTNTKIAPHPALLLQAPSNEYYVGKDEPRQDLALLNLVEEERDAVPWALMCYRISWHNDDGSLVVFPPVKDETTQKYSA